MKCSKCGNELKDGAKFCPKCGAELSNLKRYCSECGGELEAGLQFCPTCGKKVGDKKSAPNRKKLIGIGAGVVILAVIALIVGGIVINSEKAMYKAYVKFHEEYREKNANYPEYNDCAARIIMSPDNEKWLAILDITSVDAASKTSVYRYDWGKVKKVASINNSSTDDFERFSVIDSKLYLFMDSYDYDYGNVTENKDKVNGIYVLNEDNKFENVKVSSIEGGEDDDDGWSEEHYILESGYDLNDLMLLGSGTGYEDDFFVVNNLIAMDANEFDSVVEELSKHKIDNQLELQIAYGDILKKFGILPLAISAFSFSSDNPIVDVLETEYGYYYVHADESLGFVRLKDGADIEKALKSVDGREVTRIEDISYIPGCVRVPVPEDGLRIPDNIVYIGDNYNIYEDDSSGAIEIPDSVTDFGDDIFSSTTIILCNEGSKAEEYAKENHIFYINSTFDKLTEDEIRDVRTVLAYKKYISAHDSDLRELSNNYGQYSLIDVQNDGVPELVLNILGDTVFFLYINKNGDVIDSDSVVYPYIGYDTKNKRVKCITEPGGSYGTERVLEYNEEDDEYVTICEGGFYKISDLRAGVAAATLNGTDYNSYEEYESAFSEFYDRSGEEYPDYKDYRYNSVDLLEAVKSWVNEN